MGAAGYKNAENEISLREITEMIVAGTRAH